MTLTGVFPNSISRERVLLPEHRIQNANPNAIPTLRANLRELTLPASGIISTRGELGHYYMSINRPNDIPSREITDQQTYLNRRTFMRAGGGCRERAGDGRRVSTAEPGPQKGTDFRRHATGDESSLEGRCVYRP